MWSILIVVGAMLDIAQWLQGVALCVVLISIAH